MNPPQEQSPSRTCAVCCDVAADATVRVPLESLPEWRRNPGPVHGEPLPASFLKHADEQTVAGLAAVYKAIHTAGLQATNFQDWGVVAAPRFLGRPAMAAALQRFLAEGAWGVSPHLIPHRSLHSISGTVSQALKIHGPNFGTGGGPGAAAEALLAAAAMLEGQKLPGVWVVLTCLDPEQAPDEAGRSQTATQCVGLALALTPIAGETPALPVQQPSRLRIRLRVVCGTPAGSASKEPNEASGFDVLRLETLLGVLQGERSGDTTVVQLLDPGRRIELSRTGVVSIRERPSPSVPQRSLSSDSDRGHFVLADC